MQFQAAALANTGTRQGQVIEVFGNFRRVRVLAVVLPAIELDMLCPTEQVLQAHHQQTAGGRTVISACGAFAPALLLTASRWQVAVEVFQVRCWRSTQVQRRIQP
ncbi:hypothetical protein D3C77_458030 [compost metagenome]